VGGQMTVPDALIMSCDDDAGSTGWKAKPEPPGLQLFDSFSIFTTFSRFVCCAGVANPSSASVVAYVRLLELGCEMGAQRRGEEDPAAAAAAA